MHKLSLADVFFLLLLFFFFGCSGSEQGPLPAVEDFELTADEAPVAVPSNPCIENGGHPCGAENCESEETLEFFAGTNNVCCPELCKGEREIEAEEGNPDETCAAQKASDCGETKTCPDQQWMKSSDVKRCCKGACVDRVQTKLTIAGLGEVILERLDEGKFGVFYGSALKIGGVDLGAVSFARAKPLGNNEYEFTTNDGRTFRFKITSESDDAITAQDTTPAPKPKEEGGGCRSYDLPKGDAGYKVVRLNVPKQCMGKQCLLRLKLIGAPPTPNLVQTQRQILFTQIDNQISLEGEIYRSTTFGRYSQIQDAPKSGLNGDDQMLTLLGGPGGCFLYDDYPGVEQTKEKMVYMPMPKSPYFCQLEVC